MVLRYKGEHNMSQDNTPRKLRAGIVGGGTGSFIGPVHRIAAQLDNQAQVIAGAMSTDPQRAQASARAWFLPRTYSSFQEMAEVEPTLPDGIDFVIIATPNAMHLPVAKAFLGKGIHVVSDKPLTSTLEEAKELVALAERSNVLFALTHNYTGYPAV